MLYRFEVPGTPVAKGRHRTTRSGHRYTPKETIDFENRVRFAALEARIPMLEGPIELWVYAFWPMPRGRWLKRTPRPACWRTQKPDLDNVVKAVKDALNRQAWGDDSQVVSLHAHKVTARQGNPGRTVVEIREKGDEVPDDR